MKKLIILIAIAGFTFTSCDKELLTPFTPGALTDNVAIQTSADLQRIMSATYANLYNREDAVFTSVFTDEAGIGYANGGQGRSDEFIFNINTASNGPAVIWTSAYFSLSRANRVIYYADRITPVSTADADVITRLKAEALIMRAFCHIKLMSYFSTNPKDDSALAAILSNRIIGSSETGLLRATNGAFYTQIHADLNQAIAMYGTITSPYTGITKTYYANDIFAKALKARAFALKGDYVNAEFWADDVIATSGISLATSAQYTQIFYTDNEPANAEVIFRLKRTTAQNSQATNMHNGWCSVRPNLAGSPFYEVSRSLFNLLNQNALTDVRYKAIVAPSSLIDPGYATSADYLNTDRLILHKYGGTASGTNTFASTATNANNNDYKLCRISEMYFIKAEARTAAGDLPGAALAVKSVLDRRFTTPQFPAYANPTAAWKGILDQRRVEFAFEGYRFIDIKRIGALAGITGLDRDPADYSSSSTNYPGADPVNLPLNSFKWALPIPQVELNANSAIQAQQNPGY